MPSAERQLGLKGRGGNLPQHPQIAIWRFQFDARPSEGGKRKCPESNGVSETTTGDPRIGSPVCFEKLLAEIQLLQQLVVLGKVVTLQVIEELAAAARHLEEAAAAMEVLAVRAQVLGQVIDASGEQRDLDFGRTGILIVSLVF
jgi:hypothetical protein